MIRANIENTELSLQSPGFSGGGFLLQSHFAFDTPFTKKVQNDLQRLQIEYSICHFLGIYKDMKLFSKCSPAFTNQVQLKIKHLRKVYIIALLETGKIPLTLINTNVISYN